MSKFQIALISLLGAAACFTAGYYVRHFQSKIQAVVEAKERGRFKARTRFMVLKTSALSSFDEPGNKNAPESEERWLATQVQVASSRDVLLRVVKRLNLESEWRISPDEAAARIEKRLDVALENGTSVMSVTVWGDKLMEIADIANTMRDAFEEIRSGQDSEKLRRLKQTVEAQIKTQQEDLVKKQLELADLQKPSAFGRTPEDEQKVQSALTAVKQEYESSAVLLNTAREMLARLKVEESMVRNPIETLETARPPVP